MNNSNLQEFYNGLYETVKDDVRDVPSHIIPVESLYCYLSYECGTGWQNAGIKGLLYINYQFFTNGREVNFTLGHPSDARYTTPDKYDEALSAMSRIPTDPLQVHTDTIPFGPPPGTASVVLGLNDVNNQSIKFEYSYYKSDNNDMPNWYPVTEDRGISIDARTNTVSYSTTTASPFIVKCVSDDDKFVVVRNMTMAKSAVGGYSTHGVADQDNYEIYYNDSNFAVYLKGEVEFDKLVDGINYVINKMNESTGAEYPTMKHFDDYEPEPGPEPEPETPFNQSDVHFNGYPFLYVPDKIDFGYPLPHILYRQSATEFNGYPVLGTPEMHIFTYPTPFLLYAQDGVSYDANPFLKWPKMFDIEMPGEEVEELVVIPEVDWTDTMQQTYEYYIVDPGTWQDVRRLEEVISGELKHDLTAETLGSATLTTTEMLDENYIRAYLVTRQKGYEHKTCLGTFLYMTSSDDFDGVIHKYTMTGYSPLIELKEDLPPAGYFIPKESNVPQMVANIIIEHTRAEKSFDNAFNSSVILGTYLSQNYVANISDDWLGVVIGLLNSGAVDRYSLTIDARGVIGLDKYVEPEAMSPIWTFDDGNSSILMPEVSLGQDLYGIPNVVEVIYSGENTFTSIAVNDDPNSIVSTVNRKRRIVKRVTDVNLPGEPTQESLDEYAKICLESMSTISNTITYSHAYCPVRIGDCVLLNYTRAGLNNVKARIISQNIKCTPGCIISETAMYTTKLWRAF